MPPVLKIRIEGVQKSRGYSNIGLRTADDRWSVGLWGKNIFNKYYWTNTVQSSDVIIRYTGRPAEYGVTVGYRY